MAKKKPKPVRKVPEAPTMVEPTCVAIRSDGEVCGNPKLRSRKYQLCNTCYTRICKAGSLSSMKVYRKERYGRRAEPSQPRSPNPNPRFEDGSTLPDDSKDDSKTFTYGKFDVSNLERWERAFIFSRKRDIAEAFDDPSSKGIAHRWVQSELLLERLRRKAMEYQTAENFVKLDKVLSQIDRLEKTVQGLQRELNFLPSQTEDDKKTEDIFSNMLLSYRKHKARLVAGFDDEEIELMAKKGMDVELERKRIAEITGRLSMERARSLVMSIVDAAVDVARDVFNINEAQVEDLIERLSVRVKSKVPEITPFID